MLDGLPPAGRISGRRLTVFLGAWRRSGSRTAAADLAAAVRLLVLDGRLPAGTRLPAERELADALQVSRTLVGSALDKLRAESVVASRRGSGSWITLPGTSQPAQAAPGGGLIDLARAAPEAVPGVA
ncbi:MAG: GntR family transcriptional regulator, partial [Sciscionella sp.]